MNTNAKMNEQTNFWERMTTPGAELTELLQSSLAKAAEGLSEMVGYPIKITAPQIRTVPFSEIADHVASPEAEMAGIYLLIEGDASGQAALMFPKGEALYLVDLLLGVPFGTTTKLGDLECSALAEAGNLTTAFFLNQVAHLTGIAVRPSPPAVMIDMLGAILNIFITPIAITQDELLLIETVFQDNERTVQAHFWIMPV